MRIDHVAHLCRNPHATHRFYSDVLGLKLNRAYAGRELMLIYELPNDGFLVFTSGESAAQAPSREIWEREHIGLTVKTRVEFEHWLSKLKQHGISFQLVDNERIYFSDPDGLVLEIEVESRMSPDPAASEFLARWQSG